MGGKPQIIVEDNLAKMIVEKVAGSTKILPQIDVQFVPGGESSIKKQHIPVFSSASKYNYVMFDGDQMPTAEIPDIECIASKDLTEEKLRELIKLSVACDVEFIADGNALTGRRIDQIVKAQCDYLAYLKSNVRYLPKQIPEDIIIDYNRIRDLVGHSDFDALLEPLRVDSDSKNFSKMFIHKAALLYYGEDPVSPGNFSAFNAALIKHWADKKNADFRSIYETLNWIIEDFHKRK